MILGEDLITYEFTHLRKPVKGILPNIMEL